MSDGAQGVAPGFVLMPARDYKWQVKNRIEIKIPLKGKVAQVVSARNMMDDFVIPGDDDFSIFEDDVFQMWEVVRILFASSQYPDLESDECLNVFAMEINGGELTLHGEVIRSMA